MSEILEYAFKPAVIPATILLLLVILYWVIFLVGFLDLEFLDVDLDTDADLDVDVGVLDFKHAPDAALCALCREAFPDALFEDPPVVNGLTGRDQVVLTPDDAIVPAGERVNLKGPRMGGWLAVLDALARCQARGTPVYFGGMFELGVGRRQARKLAAAFAPDAWHDLAAIPPTETGSRPPVVVDATLPGFA